MLTNYMSMIIKNILYFNFNEEGKKELGEFIQEKSQNKLIKLISCSKANKSFSSIPNA